MSNEELYEKAVNAASKLHGDTSVSMAVEPRQRHDCETLSSGADDSSQTVNKKEPMQCINT